VNRVTKGLEKEKREVDICGDDWPEARLEVRLEQGSGPA